MRDALVFGRLLALLALLIAVASVLGILARDPDGARVAIGILIATGATAVLYLGRIWWSDRDRPRSPTIGLLLFIVTIIESAAIVLAWLTNRRLNGEPALDQGPAVSGLVILAMVLTVHTAALFVWLSRRASRRRGRGE